VRAAAAAATRRAAGAAASAAPRPDAADPAARAKPAYPARPPELTVAPTEPDFAASERPKPRRGRHRRVVLVTLLAVLLIGLVGGIWHWRGSWLEQWRTTRSGEPSPAAEPAVSPAPPTSPVAEATPLRFSVAIEAHQNFDIALDRLAALRAEEARFGFYLSPVLVNNNVYYRLMAGPVPDSASAAELMAELLAAGHKTGSSPADIRQAPLAFQLGTAVSRAEAERRVEELHTLAIPAYIVLHDTPEGLVYRVYGGGYASRADADVMRELLRAAGQPDSLVEREGRSPQ
jgi:cell division septation protein DedD